MARRKESREEIMARIARDKAALKEMEQRAYYDAGKLFLEMFDKDLNAIDKKSLTAFIKKVYDVYHAGDTSPASVQSVVKGEN